MPLHPEHLSTDWRGDPKQKKKRKNTIGERFEKELKNRARNRRSSWCILLFTLFLMLYYCLNMNSRAIFDMICG
jgi:hypothetical protein